MIFFDSYAIIETIKGNPNYEKYQNETIITNTLNLSEVFYSLIKQTDEKIAREIIKKIKFEFIEIDENIAINSAIFRHKNKEKSLSYADCIGYITSIKNNLTFITGDKEFKNLPKVEFIK